MKESIEKLLYMLDSQPIPYSSPVTKDAFSRQGKRVLKALASHLELDRSKIQFNRGGIAVSGEATLIGMKGDNGIYAYISQKLSGKGAFIYMRTVAHMKDYTGGPNQTITDVFGGPLGDRIPQVVERFINTAEQIING